MNPDMGTKFERDSEGTILNGRPSGTLHGEKERTIAVLIPCYNEELTIQKVVSDFKRELPHAVIYVYDNNSTDLTAELAHQAGAIVVKEPRQGKGNVVRQMIRDIDADFYLMVDGDDTYPAEDATKLLSPLFDNRADMVVGDRLSNGSYNDENDRVFHGFGNWLVCSLIHIMYGFDYNDVMSGYRAFNRQFAKTLPTLSSGFEIETELSIHAVDKRWRINEVPVAYRNRPEGSESKLSTLRDGFRVLTMIAALFKDYKPLGFFSLLALCSFVLSLALGIPIVSEFKRTGLVERLPTAILVVAFAIVAALLFSCGLILDSQAKATRRSWELEVIRQYDQKSRRGNSDQ